MVMAALAPTQATGCTASFQVVRKPSALKDARLTQINALSSSSINGAAGVFARDATAKDVHTRDQDDIRTYKGHERPDSFGRYGIYGGKYVPETLMDALSNLEVAYRATIKDPEFQVSNVSILASTFVE